MLIFTHKCVLLSAAECNPFSVYVFLYVHTTIQNLHHTTLQHSTPQQ